MKKSVSSVLAALLFFSVPPFFAAAQTSEERIETGRFGAEEPAGEDAGSGGKTYKNHWLFLGARLGPSLRIYTPSDDTPFTGGDTYGPALEAGFQASVQIVPRFSLQAEMIFTWDNAPVWFYSLNPNKVDVDRHTRRFTSFSLQFPLTVKMNFYPGKFRVSPFLGVYALAPLGKITVNDPLLNSEESVSYSFSPPLGILGGLSASFSAGPGMFFADLRYAADLGKPELKGGGDTYRRGSAALCVGYELGFFRKPQTGSAK
ncbi:MAG: hypothetical protein LBF77_04615 [Spirochaetaceae bacterium]|jgi:hypothetical protein|nr:hypothetical protein [Spirochaetaceae bacterium]